MQWHSLLLLYTTMDEKARETRMKSHGRNETEGIAPIKKGGEAALVNLSAPQAPSSRAQPRDLYCTAAICTHAPSLKRHLGASLYRLSLTHVLPVCKKDPSTSVGMTGGRRIASHSFSHRCVDPSCAFGAGRLASQEGALMGRLGASLD